MQKPGDIYISKPVNETTNVFKPKTLNERLMIKDHLAEIGRLLFLQKAFNSNLEIPG